MNEAAEIEVVATRVVHWPTGATYTCDYHANALRKIAAAMKIHVSIEAWDGDDMPCTNCLNENSIARGDHDG